MTEWGDAAPTFDRQSEAWGAAGSAWAEEEGGGLQDVELIGTQLWVAGMIDLGRFRRVSDFVNIVHGYLVIRDAVVLTRAGEATRLTMPELRVLPDDIAVLGQHDAAPPPPPTDSDLLIEKTPRRLVLVTRSHLIDGEVFIHGDGSIMAFVDATDPRFIPMTGVRVRWLADRKLAARFPFALVQRSHILGVATEGIKLGESSTAVRRAAMRADEAASPDDEQLDDSEAPSEPGEPGSDD